MNYRIVAGLELLMVIFAAHLAAQSPPTVLPPSRWIPFTAKMSEWYSVWTSGAEVGGGRYKVVQLKGVYAQNESGATYEFWSQPLTPLASLPNLSVLIDRPTHARWEIDHNLLNVRRSDLKLRGHPEFSVEPMTWEVFLKSHADDESLGRRIVSGVECVDYRIRNSETPLRMYREEICFAPSLNFQPIKYHHMYPEGKDVRMKLEKIQIGVPDPKMFQVPAGFRSLH